VLALAVASQLGWASAQTTERIGWQFEDFDDNVNLTYAPKTPTPQEPVVVRIESRNPKVFMQVAYAYITVQLPGSGPVTTGLTFSRYNETVMTATFSAYPNNTVVKFYLNVLDYFNVPAQSGNYSYIVQGQDKPGGWLHAAFLDNVNVTWRPMVPNATEPARVTITSRDGVTVYGAYLYVTYEVKVGQPQSGGFPFLRTNNTAMWCDIPGYPMGTSVRFWVSAWDKYNNLTISPYYNYTIPREEDYSNHEFADFDGLAVVGGLMAFAIAGGVAYWRVLEAERRRREKGTKYAQVQLDKIMKKGGAK
jgi:hypothetical protein